MNDMKHVIISYCQVYQTHRTTQNTLPNTKYSTFGTKCITVYSTIYTSHIYTNTIQYRNHTKKRKNKYTQSLQNTIFIPTYSLYMYTLNVTPHTVPKHTMSSLTIHSLELMQTWSGFCNRRCLCAQIYIVPVHTTQHSHGTHTTLPLLPVESIVDIVAMTHPTGHRSTQQSVDQACGWSWCRSTCLQVSGVDIRWWPPRIMEKRRIPLL